MFIISHCTRFIWVRATIRSKNYRIAHVYSFVGFQITNPLLEYTGEDTWNLIAKVTFLGGGSDMSKGELFWRVDLKWRTKIVLFDYEYHKTLQSLWKWSWTMKRLLENQLLPLPPPIRPCNVFKKMPHSIREQKGVKWKYRYCLVCVLVHHENTHLI